MDVTAIRGYWQEFPNETVSYLYLDEKMFPWHRFSDKEGLTSKQLELIELLEDIRGVKELSIGDYEVRITRGEVFAWHEIRPKVEAVLLDWLGHQSMIQPGGKGYVEPNRIVPEYRDCY